MKLSNQDKKDLDKYTKFLALKSTQIIIQSRVGDKVSTPCKPNTQGTDWFNLHINDLPDVLAETRKALNGEIISTCIPLCVEISLRTSEGDQMVLESWCLSLLPEQCDPTVRIIHTVYNRMGILLKSLVSVTRVTPAYKLSRRQGPDSYVICYRIYMDQPQLHSLGDGYKQVRIGQICTPIGTLQLSVAYRTKMTISPTQTGKNNSIMVKSDHFNSNSNPRRHRN
ncbi:autophagy-related protein 13 -like protein, partial [Asbolus verrucosus]